LEAEARQSAETERQEEEARRRDVKERLEAEQREKDCLEAEVEKGRLEVEQRPVEKEDRTERRDRLEDQIRQGEIPTPISDEIRRKDHAPWIKKLGPVTGIITSVALIIGLAIYLGSPRPPPNGSRSEPMPQQSVRASMPVAVPSSSPKAAIPETTTQASAQQTAPFDKAITVEILHYFVLQAQIDALSRLQIDFEAANPDVKLNFTYVPFAELVSRTLQMVAVHKPPGISAIDNCDVLRVAKAGILKDISTDVAKNQVWNDVYPGPKAAVTDGSKVYGMPIGSNCLALYYNKTMFADGGISTPPRTWDQLTDDIAKTSKSPVYGIAFSALITDESGTWQWEPFLWSNGGSLIDLNSEHAQVALELWVDWVKKGYASRDVVNWNQGDVANSFNSWHAATMVMGSWMLGEVKKRGIDFGIVTIPVPKDGLKPVVPLGGEVWCVLKGDSDVEKAALKFINFTQGAEQLRKLCDTFNYISSVRNIAKQQVESNPELQPFVDQMDTARARSQDGGTKYPEISLAARTAIQRTLTNRITVNEALKDAAATVKSILATK
jgi:multiple sugar transport system substrate-binding protein